MATNLNADILTPCLYLQESIVTAFGTHPGQLLTSAGAYDALMSAQNRTAFFRQISQSTASKPTDSSNRKVQARYVPTDCDPEFEFDTCDLGENASPAFKQADFTADLDYSWGFDLSEEEFRDLCDGGKEGTYGAMVLAKYQAAKRQFNAKIATALAALPGNYPTNGDNSLSSPISIPVVTGQGVYNPAGFGLLKSVFEAGNMTADPITVGGKGVLDMANNSLRYAIGNTSTGVGQNGTFIPNYFRDDTLDSIMGGGINHLIAWQPGYVQLIEWYENVGVYRKLKMQEVDGRNVAAEEKSTVVTPDGITWDFFYKDDCGVHKYRFRKYFGVAPIPEDSFGSTCQDFNGILHFAATCGDLDCNAIDQLNAGSGS